MEEARPRSKARKRREKKREKSAVSEEPEKHEESELSVLESQSVEDIKATEPGDSSVVEVENSRKPLARSDSELTSILVVGDEATQQTQEDTAPDNVEDVSSMAELDQVRREPSLTRLESAEQEEPTAADDATVPIFSDGDPSSAVVENVAELETRSPGEISDAQNEIEVQEEDAPRRNADPDGVEDAMEMDASADFEQPQKDSAESHDQSMDYSQLDEDGHLQQPWELFKDMKKEGMVEDDLSDHDGENDGNEVPKSDEVPDINEFMESVEDNDSGLGAQTPPPSLYENAQQREMHKYVIELQQKMADEEIFGYLVEFERKVEEEIIQIGDISLEDVQEEERRLREEHIAFQQGEAKIERDRQKELMVAMEKAKKHVMTMFREKCKQILMRQEHMMQRDRLLQDRIHRSFRRSENQLLKALKKRQGEIKTMYGDLIFADGQYDGSKCRRWKVDWKRTPQPIQIKLKCLRGVKNKLPASRYVLMASLYSRLGGHIMKWSNLKGQQWGGSTLPITHDGEFYNIEVTIDQSVFEVCPSSPDMKAGMVLMFELFILRGAVTPTDKVVGWGCFPISDGNFNVVEGKHKTPLLRGNIDPAVDKFGTIEKLIASDIDHWLCNLYFEIVKLPKYLAGQKEYEVELQFTSQTSKLLSREMELTEKPLYASDKEKTLPPSILASSVSLQSSKPPPSEEHEEKELYSQPGPSHFSGANLTIDVAAVPQRKNSLRSNSPDPSSVKLRKMSQISTDLRQRKASNAPPLVRQQPPSDGTTQRPFTVYGSRKVVEEKGVTLSDDESSAESQYSDDDVYVIGKGSGLKPIEGQPGMYYKVRQSHQSEHDSSKRYTMLPKTPLLTQQQKRKKLTHLEELEQHTVSIKTRSPAKQNVLRRGHTKFQYVRRMLPIELDLWAWRSKEFWSMMLMLVLTWWIRMYLHYVGQYILLVGLLIPINSIEYLPYTVTIKYQNTILRTKEEIALLIIGPFTNIMVLIVLMLVAYIFQLLLDRFPNLFSRLIMAYGIQSALDPVWILIVDTAKLRYKNLGTDNPIGDAYRLFYHFSRYYSSGTVTLFISVSMTVFLYAVTIFCSVTILYMYFMRLHNNGRMMDIYWRLHGTENSFFVPYDLEMSNEELAYICRKADQWRGQEGEQRKVNVYHYAWEEEEVAEEDWGDQKPRKRPDNRTETITHISIHTIHLDGLRELFRHFLRLNNGAIVEVFGEAKIPGSNDNARLRELHRKTSQDRSPKIGYRNRSYSGSSNGSSVAKDDQRRASSQFLGLPTAAN